MRLTVKEQVRMIRVENPSFILPMDVRAGLATFIMQDFANDFTSHPNLGLKFYAKQMQKEAHLA